MKSHRMRALGVLVVGALSLFVAVGITNADDGPSFAPTITLQTSTTRATAHPDARITIDNSASTENIKDLTLRMPDGFWGSLAVVDTKCSQSDAEAGTCAPGSKIGTVMATAVIEDGDTTADGVLSGDVFMTDAFSGNNDPAGISIAVRAKVGGVDLGKVIVNGRVKAVNGAVPVGAASGTRGPLVGIETVVTDVPQSVTDTVNSRTVSYKLDKMQIDLKSNLEDSSDPNYTPPLLTNPSKCGTTQIVADATPHGGGASVNFTDDYTVDHCASAKFDPQMTSVFTDDSSIPIETPQGIKTTVTNPSTAGQPFSSSSLSSVNVKLPPNFGANYPAFGAAADKCSGATAGGEATPTPWFSPTLCNPSTRPQAKVGEVSIETPMLPDPVKGYVYLINKTPLPWLGIDVNDTIPGNPKGINFALAGVTNLVQIDPSCTAAFCQSQVTIKFSGLPDAPTTRMFLDLDMGERERPNHTFLEGEIITTGSSDNTCQPEAEVNSDFTATSGPVVGRVETHQFSDCPEPVFNPTTGPWGQVTTSSTPSFGFSYTGSEPKQWCGFDEFQTNAVECTGSTSISPAAPLADGTHLLTLGDAATQNLGPGNGTVRGFSVLTASPGDTTVPTTALDVVPATTSDQTPTFTYNASETSEFQCSIDDGAFLPCGSADGTDSETFTVPDSEKFEASDETHTFAVRAQDSAGNVDLTPASASFKVEIPFEPQMSLSFTTQVARAHPEMTLTIDNASHEDLKDYTLKMPDGFFGALTGVQSQCATAVAQLGNCAAGSKVGDVTATAVIDRSTVVTKGSVYMTDPWEAGDPAGLVIVVKPKLQDVTFDPIVVKARLQVRGEAEGIDALTVDIPDSATSTIGEVSEFDMRKIVLDLKNNPAAAQPLLTNPSSCDASAFDATFTGSDSTVTTATQAFSVTGCTALPFGATLNITQVASDGGGVPKASTDANRVNVNFTANMAANPDGSAVKSISLTLPEPLTIDVGHLPPVCQIAEAALKACPATSAIGTAVANTPLLPEPLTGTVYVLKSETALPRLLIALRGRINTDIIAENKLVGNSFNIIQTTIDTVPDAPISSFSMNVNRFLMVRSTGCDVPSSQWSITGGMTAYSGAVTPVNIPLQFDCTAAKDPQASTPTWRLVSYRGSKKKFALTAEVKAQTGKKIKKLTVKLPSGVKFISKSTTSKRISKYVQVKADGKKLKARCFKRKSSNTIEINLCKKQAKTIVVTLKKGSMDAKKKKFTKKKPPKISAAVVDSGNKKRSATRIK